MNIISNSIGYFFPSSTQKDLYSKEEGAVTLKKAPLYSKEELSVPTSPVTLKNAPLYRNCIHFELLIVMNFAKALVELQKELFFVQCMDVRSLVDPEMQSIQQILKGGDYEKLGEALQKAKSLRVLLILEARTFLGEKTKGHFDESFAYFFEIPCDQARDKIDQIEAELSTTLSKCWNNQVVSGEIKTLVSDFLQIIEGLKEEFKEMKVPFEVMENEDIDTFHSERMEFKEYAKSYEVMNDLFLLLGDPKNPLWKCPKRVLGLMSLLVKPTVWLTSLEEARRGFREKLEIAEKKTHGENFAAVMRFQKLSIVQDTWLRTLQQIRNNSAKEHGEERGFRYTCTIMRALSTEKLLFYQHFFGNTQTLTLACLKKLNQQKGISLEHLKAEVQEKENKITEEEVLLKCYSWQLSVCGFSWTAITDNIFFRLGKELFLVSEKVSPGVKLEEPFLSGFSYLAGGAVLSSRIYCSPTVAGPTLVVHAIAQACLSDVKRLTRCGDVFFGFTEEQTLQAHSKLMLASALGVSTLMFGTSNVFQLGVGFGSSAITSHYAGKAFDHYLRPSLKPGTSPPPAYSTARLIVGLAANTFGFVLGNYAWNLGSELYFDRFSNESILFNDELCTRFKKKCLAQAYEELGVTEKTLFSEMKSVYHQLSLHRHPDKNQDINPVEFERLNSAWTIIKNTQMKNTIT